MGKTLCVLLASANVTGGLALVVRLQLWLVHLFLSIIPSHTPILCAKPSQAKEKQSKGK